MAKFLDLMLETEEEPHWFFTCDCRAFKIHENREQAQEEFLASMARAAQVKVVSCEDKGRYKAYTALTKDKKGERKHEVLCSYGQERTSWCCKHIIAVLLSGAVFKSQHGRAIVIWAPGLASLLVQALLAQRASVAHTGASAAGLEIISINENIGVFGWM